MCKIISYESKRFREQDSQAYAYVVVVSEPRCPHCKCQPWLRLTMHTLKLHVDSSPNRVPSADWKRLQGRRRGRSVDQTRLDNSAADDPRRSAIGVVIPERRYTVLADWIDVHH